VVSRTKENPWPRVKQSIDLLLKSDVAFWPRTTYTGSLLTTNDLREILKALYDSGFRGEYVIQNYVPSPGVREKQRARLKVPKLLEIEGLQNETPEGIDVKFEWR
ncbi:MAG: hypothetical protein ACFFD6_02315, partial [Candidatus Thorarchaeota archaeon]